MRGCEGIQQEISYFFKDIDLLKRALTHKSYANENKASTHNERMEFLGDAVLNLIVSEYLMILCPAAQEGDLSKYRAAVVNEQTLAAVARKLNLGDFLLLGRGEELNGGREKGSLLANSLEALTAAVYLDAGMEACKPFFLRAFSDIIKKISVTSTILDYKTALQELCQMRLKQLPEYRIVSEIGPEHRKRFEVEIFIQNVFFGRGSGKSKKEAEQCAAKEAFISFSGAVRSDKSAETGNKNS